MAIEVLPAEDGSALGMQIVGLTPADLENAEMRQKLRDLWIEHGVLVFRQVEGVAFHIALSEVFGTCAIHPLKEVRVEGREELIDIRHDSERANVHEVGGMELGAWLPWHSDLIFLAEINRGGILRPIEAPADAGHTGFIDRIAAYERLPDDLRRKIADLSVVYRYNPSVEANRFGNKWNARQTRFAPIFTSIMSRLDDYPRTVHPMVYTQQETARKVLNVSPWFALGIKGRETEEGDALLRRVVTILEDEDFAYYHEWQPGDMVLWDNWRMLHRATGIAPHRSRWLQRTTIYGDYGYGAIDREAAEEDLVYTDM